MCSKTVRRPLDVPFIVLVVLRCLFPSSVDALLEFHSSADRNIDAARDVMYTLEVYVDGTDR